MIDRSLLEQLDRMDGSSLRELLAAVEARLVGGEAAATTSPPKLADLAGVGEDFWRSIDVERYLREERDSWDRQRSSRTCPNAGRSPPLEPRTPRGRPRCPKTSAPRRLEQAARR
jgi:hypothetical protein